MDDSGSDSDTVAGRQEATIRRNDYELVYHYNYELFKSMLIVNVLIGVIWAISHMLGLGTELVWYYIPAWLVLYFVRLFLLDRRFRRLYDEALMFNYSPNSIAILIFLILGVISYAMAWGLSFVWPLLERVFPIPVGYMERLYYSFMVVMFVAWRFCSHQPAKADNQEIQPTT